MNRFFHTELEELRSNLMLMGSRTLDLCKMSMKCLIEKDLSLVEEIRKGDDAVDDLDIAIDATAVRYITLRSPVASDVRLITVAMKCSRELERTADEAVSIAKRVQRLNEAGSQLPGLFNIEEMGERVIWMLDEALDCFIQENSDKAFSIPAKDKKIDLLNHDNFTSLNEYIIDNPSASQVAVDLMFISKSLERVGDHAVNIAEEVVFLLEGRDIRHTPAVKRTNM